VPRLVIATTNEGKVREIRALLDGADVELVGLDRWPAIAPPDETGRTFEENARLKALYYADATRELVVADDSGLEIDALGGVPGVESARYGGPDTTYPQKFAMISAAMRAAKTADRTARFVCAVALARRGEVLFETRASVEGQIASEPRGSNGFGYDPIFWYPPYGATLAEVDASRKAAVSHRGQAFRALKDFLSLRFA
jgi:XTP/dITP diphosphohydrolase